jgi:DegV family protein with EDD domain
MKLRHLDGESLYYAFFHGRRAVVHRQKHLNKINVFPVADGDTGTNLAMTMHSMIEGTSRTGSVASVSRGMADAALSGSRGNSGIIFAQFVRGLSEAVQGKDKLDKREFTQAARRAVDSAYKALSKPVEGTILTVMHAWVNALDALHEKKTSFVSLFHESLVAARRALQETPKMMKALEKANVVDAGAEGFVTFLEGVMHFVRSGEKPELLNETLVVEEAQDGHMRRPDEEIRFRYCTEFLLEGKDLSLDSVRKAVENMGDSAAVAGGGNRLRVHIHSNEPWMVYEACSRIGHIVKQKVEDMIRQNQIAHHRRSGIAVVTDSACDLPQEWLDRYQIHVVPLNLAFGEKQYLDQLTIKPDQFYRMLEEEPEFPKTSQPSNAVFADLYRRLSHHYHSIISIHLSGGLSGTINSVRLAAEQVKDVPIAVIDSRNLTSSLGLMVITVAEAVASGKRFADVVRLAESLPGKTRLLVGVPTLKSYIRGGRISPFKGLIARLLNLKPIISINSEGKAVLFGKAFSRRQNLEKIVGIVSHLHRDTPIRRYVVGHTADEPAALAFAGNLERAIGMKPEFIAPISPVIGAHAGPGSVCVCFMTD